MAVLIEILVMMILYHGWNLKSIILFAFGQGTIFQFWTPDCLRGYGTGTPNGALWTIGVMIQFYIVAWLFYKFMDQRKIKIWIIGLCISFIFSYGLNLLTHKIFGIELIGKLYD